jgi:5-methylcytosine-specific restriction protein A
MANVLGSQGRRLTGRKGQRIRAMVLREEPLCRHCLASGRVSASVEVDHIVPLGKGGGGERENMQGLCAPCHKAKSAAEASGKPRIGIDGVPEDGSWQ